MAKKTVGAVSNSSRALVSTGMNGSMSAEGITKDAAIGYTMPPKPPATRPVNAAFTVV